MAWIYGQKLTLNDPTTIEGRQAFSDVIDVDQVPVGDVLAVKTDTVVIDLVQNVTKVGYWTAPFACRVRAIGLLSSQTTDGAGVDLTIQAAIGATDLIASTVFDASPALTADTLALINDTSTPVLTNFESVAKDAVLKITAGASNDASWVNDTLAVIIHYEPRLSDTSKTTQATRSYVRSERSKDS